MTTLTEEQFDDAFSVGTLENFDEQRVKLLQDNYPDLYRLIKDGDHIQTLNNHNHLKATLFAMGIIDDSMLKQSMLPESNWDALVKHVWTVIDGEDDDGLYALPGVHINSVYYIVTDKPWTPDIEEAVYMAPDNDLEDEDEYDLEDELADDNESSVNLQTVSFDIQYRGYEEDDCIGSFSLDLAFSDAFIEKIKETAQAVKSLSAPPVIQSVELSVDDAEIVPQIRGMTGYPIVDGKRLDIESCKPVFMLNKPSSDDPSLTMLFSDNELIATSLPIHLSSLTNTAKNTQDLNVATDVEVDPTALTIAQAEEDARIVVHQDELGFIDAASTIVKNDGSVIQRVVLTSNHAESPTYFDKDKSVGYVAFPPGFVDIIAELKDKMLFSGGAITTIEASLNNEKSPTLLQLSDELKYDDDVIDTPQGMPFDVQLMAFVQEVDFKVTADVMGVSVTSNQINLDQFIDKATINADNIVEVAFEKVEKKPKPSGPGMM